MFRASNEADPFLEKNEDSALREDDTAQTLSFEITPDASSLSQSGTNDDLLSSSAPVFIPGHPENASQSAAGSPTGNMEEYEKETLFGSYVTTQSLKVTDAPGHRHHHPVQRAISTDPRMERTDSSLTTTQFPSYEDPLFPFLNPDLGPDMNASDEQFKSTDPIPMNGKANDQQSGMDSLQKRKWQILKGMSEANISSTWNPSEPHNNSMTVLNSSEVQPKQKLRGRLKFAASVKVPKKENLGRKTSVSSNLSYLFGSGIFPSPARSQVSMTSDQVNYIVDPASIFPSLMSLTSFEVVNEDDDAGGLRPPSHPRSVSAYNSRQNSGNDLQALEKKRTFTRSHSATSRGSSSSLSTRIFRDNDADKLATDEESDKLTEVRSMISRPQGPKKLWQQTMPDLEEGPESDTLTVQSTIRNNLAAAALAIGLREKKISESRRAEEEEVVEKVVTPATYTKNLLILSFAYFACFTSYMSLRNLQSSLNNAGGLGMISLSCVYASIFIGSIFTTTIVQRLRPKLSIIISFLGLLFYNITNFYPSYATLVPGSIVAGFSMAITWTAQATYLANNALTSSKLSGKKFSEVLALYQGVFFSCYQMSQVMGGLISSFIFSLQRTPENFEEFFNTTSSASSSFFTAPTYNSTAPTYIYTTLYPSHNNTTYSPFNSTSLAHPLHHPPPQHIDHLCAMQYCPGSKKSELDIKIEPLLYFIMISVFMSFIILALFIIILFLNPLEGVLKKSSATLSSQLSSVFRIATDTNMICLMPLMSYSLLQTTFMFGEFNKAHVTCVLGIHMIGYMTVFLAFISSIVAFSSGNLQRFLGNEPVVVTGLLCHLTLLVVFWFWTPTREGVVWFFVVVSVWGAGDGMIMAQIVSTLGTLFMTRKEAAFSAYKMVQSMSAFVMFITGAYICTRTKVIILTLMVVLSLVGMAVLKVKANISLAITRSNKNVLPVRTVNIQVDSVSK